jgi:putative glutamine amidotransferase
MYLPRPVIGIATQTQQAVAGQTPLAWIMGQQYVRVLTEGGALPWLVPLLSGDEVTLRCIYNRLDGVFLTGGVDVNPANYGEPLHALCGPTDADRDETEMHLIRWARADRKPVLGVCRGHQMIDVALGGTLYQDVGVQHPQAIKHDYFPSSDYTRDYVVHDVEVTPGSRLDGLLGARRVRVNSMHHQGVKRLAPELRATALAPDGLIEGLEGVNGQFLVGVQWHPEELTDKDPSMRRLFGSFLAAASLYQVRA